MRPVEKLAEQVAALSSALYHLKMIELQSPMVAKVGAWRVLSEIQSLKLAKAEK